LKTALTSIAAAVSIGIASLTGAQATPISQIPASPPFFGNVDATLLQLIQDDEYQGGYGRRRYGDGEGYGRRRSGDGEGYGRRGYGEGEGYGRRGFGDGGDAHARRLRIIWCTQHPGRC
jgi:hypothetical protein